MKSNDLKMFNSQGSDYIDRDDYNVYKKYLEGKSRIVFIFISIACLYYGEGKLAEGAFSECSSGVAVFHDYSVGMPQRSVNNRLNETYFFYPYSLSILLICRDDRKLTRKRTCEQLRDYINIPIDGYYAKHKMWKTAPYRKVLYDVVILNGPCRSDIGRNISFYENRRNAFLNTNYYHISLILQLLLFLDIMSR